MDKGLFRDRLMCYMHNNLNFGIYYDKIYKKEYLPSRIRYNQFFFYAALFGGVTLMMKASTGGGAFCVKKDADPELANRKFFSSDRACVNIFMRQMNKGAMSSHVAK